MSLPIPRLDLRSFDQLLESAKKVIGIYDSWTDRSVHDPGMILLEAFAHLTEVLIYRVNRLPERAHIELLRLLGVRLHPASAAKVTLRFRIQEQPDAPVRIPRGTRVSTKAGSPPVVFSTARDAIIEPGNTYVEVLACHCQMETESLGSGTGQGGLRLHASGPFADAGREPELDMVVGVAVGEGEAMDRSDTRVYNQGVDPIVYRVWREVDSFSPASNVRYPVWIDRAAGVIQFAPALRSQGKDGTLSDTAAAIAEVPANQRDVRVWGPRGGGKQGNVPAGTLVHLLDPVEGVKLEVTNAYPATGGRDAESLTNALLRGPMTFRTVERAISAADYEWLAVQASNAVRRAKAFTRRDLWCFAKPGTVEVVLVPDNPDWLDGSGEGPEYLRREVLKDLEGRKALGTRCEVSWARYKPVSVKARVVVHAEEDLEVAKQRLEGRLREAINPLAESPKAPTWKFGTALVISNVYDIVQADPAVHRMENLRLCVEDAPNRDIRYLERDAFQPQTWYAGGPALYRSLNDGDSWEPWLKTDEGAITRIRSHPMQKGLLAAATRYTVKMPDGNQEIRSRVLVSRDCGERWDLLQETSEVYDVAWLPDPAEPIILIATNQGLFRGPLVRDSRDLTVPVKIEAREKPEDQTIYAVSGFIDPRGDVAVAVAMSGNRGVYLSNQAGKRGTFHHIGPSERLNIQSLVVQTEGTQSWLWAGTGISGREGQACWRRDLRGAVDSQEGWQEFSKGWKGGACYGLAVADDWLLAATGDRGVLRLHLRAPRPKWVVDETFESGLPQKGAEELYHPVYALAVRSGSDGLAMAGGPQGVYRSADRGERFSSCCRTEFSDRVSLPKTWLIRSGLHDLEVVYDHGQG